MAPSTAAPQVAARPKHETLYDSIIRLNQINVHLENLLCRIEGEPRGVDGTQAGDPDVSLQHVLHNGAETIDDGINKAIHQIEAIEDLLF